MSRRFPGEADGHQLQYSCLEDSMDRGAWRAVIKVMWMWSLSLKFFIVLYLKVVLVVKNPPANAGDIRVWVWSLGQEDPLEEDMATHSSIIAWRIPWTEEPGGLQSVELQSQIRLKWLSMHALFLWFDMVRCPCDEMKWGEGFQAL